MCHQPLLISMLRCPSLHSPIPEDFFERISMETPFPYHYDAMLPSRRAPSRRRQAKQQWDLFQWPPVDEVRGVKISIRFQSLIGSNKAWKFRAIHSLVQLGHEKGQMQVLSPEDQLLWVVITRITKDETSGWRGRSRFDQQELDKGQACTTHRAWLLCVSVSESACGWF